MVNEIIHDFENPKSDETIISVRWFDERPKLGICLHSAEQMRWKVENSFKKNLTRTLNGGSSSSSRDKHAIWNLSIKDKPTHLSHVIYKGKCICGQTYIDKTARNLEVRVNEHLDARDIRCQ